MTLLACVCARAWAFDWQVEITPAGELFPALQLSQSPGNGEGNGLVSVRLRGADLPHKLRLRIDTRGLRAPLLLDATTPPRTDALALHPKLDWDVAALRRLAGTRRQTVHVTLESAGRRETRSIEVRLHPLDDAVYFVREGADKVDLGWSFAAYVDPHDPVVDAVLVQARLIDAQLENGGHDAATDLRRVAAVWSALEQHGLRYAQGNPALSHGPAIWSQRVRLPGEVWRERRANCLDSSVLIASVLERIGLHPFIALVPGHAFVGYRDNEGRPVALETTLLGAPRTPANPSTFARARAAGIARWRKVASRLDGRHAPDYALIDIGTARTYGIIPLAVDAFGKSSAGAGPVVGNASR